MVSCKNCNNVFDESFGICPKCGTAYVPEETPAPAEVRFVSLQNSAQAKEKKAGKKSSKGKIIAIIAVICAVIIGIVLTAVIVATVGQTAQAAREQISLGEKYMTDEDYDEAIIAFEKAIEIDPNNVDAYKKLAEAYRAVGNNTEAVRALRRGYDKTGNSELKSMLDEYSQSLGIENAVKGASVRETGSIGELQYTIYDNGVTVINGGGAIPDVSKSDVLWKSKRVTEVYLADGVTEIGRYAFRNCDTITSIHIPKTVIRIGEWAFNDSDRLTSIEVDPDNNYYASVDGVLYNRDKTLLEAYPCGRYGSYVVPYTVTAIQDWAFAGCMKLTYIAVESGGDSFAAHDGVLFTKEFDSLTAYPAARNGDAVYTIPDTVKTVMPHAFYCCERLDRIEIPSSVEEVRFHAFESLTADQSIFLKGRQSIPYSWDGKWKYKCKAEIVFDEEKQETVTEFEAE